MNVDKQQKRRDHAMTGEEMAKLRIYATIREDLVKWVDDQVEKLRFANRSHALEYALAKLVEEEKRLG